MAQGIVQSLFGMPSRMPNQPDMGGSSFASQRAMMGAEASQGLQQNLGRMFGVVPPQEKLQQIIQQAQQQADLATPEGLNLLANMMNQHPELSGMAMGIRQEAAKMAQGQTQMAQQQQLGQAKIQLTEAQTAATIAESERKAREEERKLKLAELDAEFKQNQLVKEEQLRKELSNLGDNATEDQYMRVMMKYGSPDKILAALQASESRRERLTQQRELALQRIEIAKQNSELRLSAAAEKKLDKEEAKQNKLQSSMGVADNVISVANLALEQVNGFTAGMLGKPLSVIGVPAAVDLEENLKTIQANLGFKELQQMRDASPTGGALGQVALKELEFLQAALTSLSNRQSPKQLQQNLQKVVKHYTNWRNIVGGTQEQQSSSPASQQAPTQQPVATRRFNPTTGQIEPIR